MFPSQASNTTKVLLRPDWQAPRIMGKRSKVI